MILADYFLSEKSIQWDWAKQCGVTHAVVRLPETADFEINNPSHWQSIYDKFISFGITPCIIEPMPNELHDHIKAGDSLRDESIAKAIGMLPIMDKLNIRTICFNWMAHIGWLRTSTDIAERGDALVTGFDMNDFVPTDASISADELWYNYKYFIDAIIPEAEKYGISLALHPDDPPVDRLGNVSRIMTSFENIKKAIEYRPSESLGVTMCQACYKMMGEDLFEVIPYFKDKIRFIHFRNASGNKMKFRETFHDNGDINMAEIMNLYKELGINVPIRVDHTPIMAGDTGETPGYTYAGRLFAIGYLKGLLEQERK